MMIRYTILPILFLLASVGGNAQKDRPDREEIESQKRAFISNKLNLTVDEAEKFWPLYNEFHEKMKKIRDERRELRPKKDEFESLSDKEVEEMMEKHFELKQKELDLEKEYMKKFKTVLPVKKVAKLPVVEDQFKRKLLQEIRKRKKGHQGSPSRRH